MEEVAVESFAWPEQVATPLPKVMKKEPVASRVPRKRPRIASESPAPSCSGRPPLKSRFIRDEPRFRHMFALRKLTKEFGYEDTPELRDVITLCNGRVPLAVSHLMDGQ